MGDEGTDRNNAALYGPLPVKKEDIRIKYEKLAEFLNEFGAYDQWFEASLNLKEDREDRFSIEYTYDTNSKWVVVERD